MPTFADRAREVMAAKGLGTNEVNRAMGKEMGFLSNLLKRTAPRTDTMQLLAGALGVRLEWLTTGLGPRDLDASPTSSGTRHKTFKDLPGWPEAERKARARYRRIPEIGWIGAGSLMAANPPEHIDEAVVLAFAQAWLASATEDEMSAAAIEEGLRDQAEEERRYHQRRLPLDPVPPKKPPKPRARKKPAA